MVLEQRLEVATGRLAVSEAARGAEAAAARVGVAHLRERLASERAAHASAVEAGNGREAALQYRLSTEKAAHRRTAEAASRRDAEMAARLADTAVALDVMRRCSAQQIAALKQRAEAAQQETTAAQQVAADLRAAAEEARDSCSAAKALAAGAREEADAAAEAVAALQERLSAAEVSGAARMLLRLPQTVRGCWYLRTFVAFSAALSAGAHRVSLRFMLFGCREQVPCVPAAFGVSTGLLLFLQEEVGGLRAAIAQQADCHDEQLVASHAVTQQWQRYAAELQAQLPADDAAGGETQESVADAPRDAGGFAHEACCDVATDKVLCLIGFANVIGLHICSQNGVRKQGTPCA
jgi:hypothetical protein